MAAYIFYNFSHNEEGYESIFSLFIFLFLSRSSFLFHFLVIRKQPNCMRNNRKSGKIKRIFKLGRYMFLHMSLSACC